MSGVDDATRAQLLARGRARLAKFTKSRQIAEHVPPKPHPAPAVTAAVDSARTQINGCPQIDTAASIGGLATAEHEHPDFHGDITEPQEVVGAPAPEARTIAAELHGLLMQPQPEVLSTPVCRAAISVERTVNQNIRHRQKSGPPPALPKTPIAIPLAAGNVGILLHNEDRVDEEVADENAAVYPPLKAEYARGLAFVTTAPVLATDRRESSRLNRLQALLADLEATRKLLAQEKTLVLQAKKAVEIYERDFRELQHAKELEIAALRGDSVELTAQREALQQAILVLVDHRQQLSTAVGSQRETLGRLEHDIQQAQKVQTEALVRSEQATLESVHADRVLVALRAAHAAERQAMDEQRQAMDDRQRQEREADAAQRLVAQATEMADSGTRADAVAAALATARFQHEQTVHSLQDALATLTRTSERKVAEVKARFDAAQGQYEATLLFERDAFAVAQTEHSRALAESSSQLDIARQQADQLQEDVWHQQALRAQLQLELETQTLEVAEMDGLRQACMLDLQAAQDLVASLTMQLQGAPHVTATADAQKEDESESDQIQRLMAVMLDEKAAEATTLHQKVHSLHDACTRWEVASHDARAAADRAQSEAASHAALVRRLQTDLAAARQDLVIAKAALPAPGQAGPCCAALEVERVTLTRELEQALQAMQDLQHSHEHLLADANARATLLRKHTTELVSLRAMVAARAPGPCLEDVEDLTARNEALEAEVHVLMQETQRLQLQLDNQHVPTAVMADGGDDVRHESLRQKLRDAEDKLGFVFLKFRFMTERCNVLESTCHALLDAGAKLRATAVTDTEDLLKGVLPGDFDSLLQFVATHKMSPSSVIGQNGNVLENFGAWSPLFDKPGTRTVTPTPSSRSTTPTTAGSTAAAVADHHYALPPHGDFLKLLKDNQQRQLHTPQHAPGAGAKSAISVLQSQAAFPQAAAAADVFVAAPLARRPQHALPAPTRSRSGSPAATDLHSDLPPNTSAVQGNARAADHRSLKSRPTGPAWRPA